MDLREAFDRQKIELLEVKRENAKLNKQVERYNKEIAATEVFQRQLGHIQGLNNKISELTRICSRYEDLYRQEKEENRRLTARLLELEEEKRAVHWQLDCLQQKRSFEGMTAAEEAEAKIRALSDEVARLTALAERNGTNTGIPTSRTALNQKKIIPNSREKTSRNKGAQPGHKKHALAPFTPDEITQIQVHSTLCCPECGGFLEKIRNIRKDELDYEVVVVKRRHIFEECRCIDCGKTVRTKDSSLKAENQYGPVIQASALSLMNLGFVSMSRTKKLLDGLSKTPLNISEGYLAKLQKRYAGKLSDFVEEVRSACIGSDILYWDDTVTFINTARACMRFYGNERFALYCAHKRKDLAGILQDGILQSLPSSAVVVHDHNVVNYRESFSFQNVECLQHLERDLQKIADSSGHSWAKELKELIQTTIHKRKLRIAAGIDHFDEQEIASFLRRYDLILENGYKEYFQDCSRYYSRDENALQLRLKRYRQNYTAWVRDFRVPTTNNVSERALRFVKSKDKISGQFESEQYAQFFAAIHTYVETCARNGVNEFQALLRLTQGKPYTLRELLSQQNNGYTQNG